MTKSPKNEVRASVQMRPSSPLFLTLRLLADTGLLVKVMIKESIAVEENVRPRHEKYHICSLSYPPPPHPLSHLHTSACLAPLGSTPLGKHPGFRTQRSLPLQRPTLSAICAPSAPFLRFLRSVETCSSYWTVPFLLGKWAGPCRPIFAAAKPSQDLAWGKRTRLSQCLDSEYGPTG